MPHFKFSSFYFPRRLVTILTQGVGNYLQKKWMSREFPDRSFTEADSIGVTIGHVQGLLIVFGLSVAVAAIIMLAELVTAGRRSSKILKAHFNKLKFRV